MAAQPCPAMVTAVQEIFRDAVRPEREEGPVAYVLEVGVRLSRNIPDPLLDEVIVPVPAIMLLRYIKK